MAEVAGIAVGVVSLGLQVCHGITSYYQPCKNQDHIIADFLGDVDNLNKSLEVVRSGLFKIDQSQFGLIQQAEGNIAACDAATKRLDALLAKCRQTTVPLNIKERAQMLARKAAFPFRLSTVKELRDTLKALQANAALAIQALQLSVTRLLTSDHFKYFQPSKIKKAYSESPEFLRHLLIVIIIGNSAVTSQNEREKR